MVEIQHGTHLGKPAVFFKAEDYFVNLAKECRFTIIGKFYRGKPSMEEIRKTFIRQFQLSASVKIAYFDPKHVYLDFANEVDYNHVFANDYIDIGDAPMKILKWTPDFKPEEETPIVPVWILIHQLPWHLFKWNIVSRLVQDVGVAVAPDLATYSKSRGNVAKVKVEIDLLKPRLDQIWLGYKRLDGTDDGKWLDIEYEKVPSYCVYCKMQGHCESQCRNNIRDERIKAQKEAQLNKEKEQKRDKSKDDEFQMVSKKKSAKVRQIQNHQSMNQDLRGKAKNGIVINEPTEMKMSPMKEDVPGKGKNKMEEETKQNNIQRSEQNINKKKRVRVKKKNQIINSNEAQLQNTTLGKGQPSSKKTDTTTKPSEQNTSNKEDNNTPINNDQNSRHSFQENNTNGEKNTNLIEEEGNSRSGSEQNNNKNNHAIDPGDAHNTYLKLISGTSLEEDKESENMYISNNIQMAESSFEDDGEEDSEEDGDYEDDMSIEETDNFESVDSESFQNEDQPVNHTIDDHAALLIETFNSNALVEINVSSKIDKIVERDHLSPRGRGRGRNNIKRGSHKPRGKGGRFTYQQVAVIPQEQNLSN
ncbi:hypothetical protein A4A49_28326 [Nicotiana attenuata]|uniref:DUF4283 domain-containing protein n=2 Tax=Nicotiana attenuata TaxID=49451 RepID=A0A314L0R0_NICAT|nr:hypothetical protein A4A49_28326 [Nicotiana attenuata]